MLVIYEKRQFFYNYDRNYFGKKIQKCPIMSWEKTSTIRYVLYWF